MRYPTVRPFVPMCLLGAASMLLVIFSPAMASGGDWHSFPSAPRHVEQEQPSLEGLWEGSLTFDFAGEVVEAELSLLLRQGEEGWTGNLIFRAGGEDGLAAIPAFHPDEGSFSFRLTMLNGQIEFEIEAGLADDKLAGTASVFFVGELAGTSPFTLTRRPTLEDVFLTLAGQRADPNFRPPIEDPAYPPGEGPVVLIDEAHYNFHTMEGRYSAFADLLARDGYIVRPNESPFDSKSLAGVDILVIANALARGYERDWFIPITSAFTDEEIAAVREWVISGGSLLLIADHMPWPGAAQKLAAAFGVTWSNGYAVPEEPRQVVFRREEVTLADHPITNGRRASESVNSIVTFTGSAFQAPEEADPILIFGEDFVSYMPETADQAPEDIPTISVSGWFQGAVMRLGEGRVAFFGEAAMFSAQLAGLPGQPMGMNNPAAAENVQFLLNLIHWLSGLLS